MKIAKKVLAVAMAVAMIACFAAMAFAAEDKIVLKAGEIVDGKFNVTVVAKDYADLKDANWEIAYDKAVVNCVAANNGLRKGEFDFDNIAADPLAQLAMGGKVLVALNATDAGVVKAGFAFEEALGKTEEVVLFNMDFEVVDAEAAAVELKLTGSNENTLNVTLKEVVEEPEQPETETPEQPETPDVDVKDEPEVDDGDNKTGDTGVLALAAGVVAVAGAAFVVSKKRK